MSAGWGFLHVTRDDRRVLVRCPKVSIPEDFNPATDMGSLRSADMMTMPVTPAEAVEFAATVERTAEHVGALGVVVVQVRADGMTATHRLDAPGARAFARQLVQLADEVQRKVTEAPEGASHFTV